MSDWCSIHLLVSVSLATTLLNDYYEGYVNPL